MKVVIVSTPNNEGIATVKRKRDTYSKKTVVSKIVATFFALIMTQHNFIFN